MDRDEIVAEINLSGGGDKHLVSAGELESTLKGQQTHIDVHPPLNITLAFMFPNGSGTAFIKPGMYSILLGARFSNDEGRALPDKLLMLHDLDMVESHENVDFRHVRIVFQEGEGDEYEENYWAMQDVESGEYATLVHVLDALSVIASLKLIRDKIGLVVDVDAENRPMVIRTGKLFTEAMRGKPKKGDVWDSGEGFTIEMGQLAISSDNEKALETAIGGNKTLIQLNALATESGYKYEPDKPCRIETTLDEIIEQRGGDAKNKKTRAKVTKELKAISSIAWNFENIKGDFVRIPLAGGMCSVRHGRVSFAFSAEYMGAVIDRTAGRLPLDRALLTTDDKNNPNATPIGFKLCTHTYQNKGKKNENTLSVSSLLDYVNGIPSYEEVSKGNRNYTDRIIRPLERDLNHLIDRGFIEYWDYCHTNGEPLTDEEQAARLDESGNDATLPYDMAIQCNIQWRLTEEYAEHMAETMESREKKRQDAEAAKQRNDERQKRIERKKESYIAKAAAKQDTEQR